MFPKAYVIARLHPGRLARPQQPDAQPRPALRRRDHQGHSRLAGADRQEQPRSARRVCVGPERRSEMVHPGRLRPLHPAACDLHHRQGRRGRPERPGDRVAARRLTRCSRCSRTRCRRSRRARCCRPATSRRSRPISRTSTRGPGASDSSANSDRARHPGRRQHQPRRQARIPRHEPGAADSEGRPERRSLESERAPSAPGAGRCDSCRSRRCRTASGGWTC